MAANLTALPSFTSPNCDRLDFAIFKFNPLKAVAAEPSLSGSCTAYGLKLKLSPAGEYAVIHGRKTYWRKQNPGNSSTKGDGVVVLRSSRLFPLAMMTSLSRTNPPASSLSCPSTSYSGLKLSPTGCSLKKSGSVLGPNPGKGDGVVVRATAGSVGPAESAKCNCFARRGLLFLFPSLFNTKIRITFNTVLKAFHYPFTVTPVRFAVGTVLLISMWTFVVYKWAKMTDARLPDNVPLQRGDGDWTTKYYTGNWREPPDYRHINYGAGEGDVALPAQQIVNVSVNVTLCQDGAVPAGGCSNPNRPVSTGSSIPLVKM